MNKKFGAKDFDKVVFINNEDYSKELNEAKDYLKDIQMTVNIGDLSDSLFEIENLHNIKKEDEERLFLNFKESIFSNVSLTFLEKVKFLTSFEGINIEALETADFGSLNNFVYLNQNLKKHCTEFITAIWDSILLIKMRQAKDEKSILVDGFNELFANLTKIKTGNSDAYVKKEDSLDMIGELVLFLQYYIPDFFIYLLKSEDDISSKALLEKSNKAFTEILKKSQKIAHRLQMLEQIKSNNYQLLLKLLIEQKNSEIRVKPFIPTI